MWPWHDCIVTTGVPQSRPLSPALQSPALQRWCFHNPLSLNRCRRYVLTVAGDYVDLGTMANSLNTEHSPTLFLSETKWPSYYISSLAWYSKSSKSVDNQDRQPSHNTRESNIDNILSHWQSQSPRYGLFFYPPFNPLMNLFFSVCWLKPFLSLQPT